MRPALMRPVLALALLSLLAACAQPAAPVPEVRRQVPAAQVRAEMLAAAEREWRAFGGRRGGQVVLYRADQTVAVDPVGQSSEDDRRVYERMVLYWAAVGEGGFSTYDECAAAWTRPGAKKCAWHLPWSAAFVSYLMLQAGVPESEFAPDASHVNYLQGIVARSMDGNPGYFLAHDIAAYAPRPGDLVCATRGVEVAADWRLLRGQKYPMHCDLVVANRGEAIEAIGGNVFNAVSRSVIAARDGRLTRDTGRNWIVVVENRYPDAPPQTPAATSMR
ncbi:MAG: DUF2272 domain-containing protein [Reyranellaceae bacterium]